MGEWQYMGSRSRTASTSRKCTVLASSLPGAEAAAPVSPRPRAAAAAAAGACRWAGRNDGALAVVQWSP